MRCGGQEIDVPHLKATRLGLELLSGDGDRVPLRDFDLELREGEALAIVAADPALAAGLLRAVCGRIESEVGGILIDGREMHRGDPRLVLLGPRPEGIGLRRVLGYLRGAAARAGGRDLAPRALERWVRHCLHLAGGDDLAGQRLNALCAASAARVQLARALACEASILFFDHVFDGLDEVACRQAIDLVLELQHRLSCSMVFATADPEQAVLFADRVLCLSGPPNELRLDWLEVDLIRPRARLDLVRAGSTQQALQELRRLLGDRDREARAASAPQRAAGGRREAVVKMADWVSARQPRSGKRLEKSAVALGFVPLVDCAPLAIALEEGFFAAAGLEVTLSRESSWSNVQDKVSLGLLDGAQMPAAMPLAASLTPGAVPLLSGLALGRNGNAVTVSGALHECLMQGDLLAEDCNAVATAHALAAEVTRRRQAQLRPLVFAVVSPHSCHNYLLRYWLACGGIDPDRDVKLLVVPPPQMVGYLGSGMIDGFCAGEPWNTVAEHEGIGRILLASSEIWHNHPEKVLGVTRAWAEAHPNSHKALMRALLDACWWLDKEENRTAACEILAQGRYVNVAPELLLQSLGERSGEGRAGQVFHAGGANFPWQSQAAWLLSQMVRWGQVRLPADPRPVCAASFRSDLYLAAAAFGDAQPADDWKAEGAHAGPWQAPGRDRPVELGPDLFMDGRVLADWQLAEFLAGDRIPTARPAATADHAA